MGSVSGSAENFSDYASEAVYYADLAVRNEGESGKRFAMVSQTYATLALAVATREG